MKTVVVDYGIGNLLSVCRAFASQGADVQLTDDHSAILAADRVVLPGVGAFGKCVAEVRARGLDDVVRQRVRQGRPLLGICVGMQMLFEVGEEFGAHEGLGLLPGRVAAIPSETERGPRRKIPHIGWNALQPAQQPWAGTLLAATEPEACVYFVHSFSARPADPNDTLATVNYMDFDVVAAVQRGPLMGTQFHPEKSGQTGLKIVRQFLTS